MPRTVFQNSRKRIQAFYRHCAEYALGRRKAPPRLKVTLPTWEKEARALGVDPEDVFDNFREWKQAVMISRQIGTTPEEELEILWNRHRWRVMYRNRKSEPRQESTQAKRDQVAIERAARTLSTKFRSEAE